MQRIIAEHRLDVRGKRVVLKPNLVEFDQNTVINTHPKMVHAALEAFRAAGAADVTHRRGSRAPPRDAGPGRRGRLLLHRPEVRIGLHGSQPG